jgi:7,8-dihydropterin-6-yl-methyl-4-(beta-D-ribofuranosyl)aminobenzene 5'-phosphate synthase
MPRLAVIAAVTLSCAATAALQEPASRITVIYDAFGRRADLQKDWGFAALVEYGGRRILFDTGNNAAIFAQNVERLGIDLSRLDAAVISHRHGDHTTGLSHLLRRNPGVSIYAPQEGAFFKSAAPRSFFARQPDLPPTLRYFDGNPPEQWESGTPWPEGHFEIVTKTTEILPGFYVLTVQSQKPGTIEMNETSLAIRTRRGLAVVVGCSHPGVEKILQEAAKIDPKLYTVTGGFHLVLTPPEEVQRVATLLRDSLKIERVAPGHCTSELGFAVFLEQFRDRFDHAGAGGVIPLP